MDPISAADIGQNFTSLTLQVFASCVNGIVVDISMSSSKYNMKLIVCLEATSSLQTPTVCPQLTIIFAFA